MEFKVVLKEVANELPPASRVNEKDVQLEDPPLKASKLLSALLSELHLENKAHDFVLWAVNEQNDSSSRPLDSEDLLDEAVPSETHRLYLRKRNLKQEPKFLQKEELDEKYRDEFETILKALHNLTNAYSKWANHSAGPEALVEALSAFASDTAATQARLSSEGIETSVLSHIVERFAKLSEEIEAFCQAPPEASSPKGKGKKKGKGKGDSPSVEQLTERFRIKLHSVLSRLLIHVFYLFSKLPEEGGLDATFSKESAVHGYVSDTSFESGDIGTPQTPKVQSRRREDISKDYMDEPEQDGGEKPEEGSMEITAQEAKETQEAEAAAGQEDGSKGHQAPEESHPGAEETAHEQPREKAEEPEEQPEEHPEEHDGESKAEAEKAPAQEQKGKGKQQQQQQQGGGGKKNQRQQQKPQQKGGNKGAQQPSSGQEKEMQDLIAKADAKIAQAPSSPAAAAGAASPSGGKAKAAQPAKIDTASLLPNLPRPPSPEGEDEEDEEEAQGTGGISVSTLFLTHNGETKKASFLAPEAPFESKLKALFQKKFPGCSIAKEDKIYVCHPGTSIFYELEDFYSLGEGALLKIHHAQGATGGPVGTSGSVEEDLRKIKEVLFSKNFQTILQTPEQLQRDHETKTQSERDRLQQEKKTIESRIATVRTSLAPPLARLRNTQKELAQSFSLLSSRTHGDLAQLRSQLGNYQSLLKKMEEEAKKPVREVQGEIDRVIAEKDRISAALDELRDLIDQIKADVTKRKCKPSKAQLTFVKERSDALNEEVAKLIDDVKVGKPKRKKVWEVELQTIMKEQKTFKELEEEVPGFEDDLEEITELFEKLEKISEIQSKRKSQPLDFIPPEPEYDVGEGEQKNALLNSIKAVQLNEEESNKRLKAMALAEKTRKIELESKVDEFEDELAKFVGNKKFKHQGGFEEIERLRQERDKQVMMGIFNA